MGQMILSKTLSVLAGLAIVASLLFPAGASAHDVSKRDGAFVQANKGAAVAPFLYLGAKHMVTGYDHLLFLVGVIFFLYQLKDVVLYVSLFTIGHSTTLLLVFSAMSMQILTSSMPSSVFRLCTRRSTTWTDSSGCWNSNRTPRLRF